MKKVIVYSFIALVGVFALSSCGGGGYTEESKAQLKDLCATGMKMTYTEADAASICDCYVNKLIEKYPTADFTPEQNVACMDECSATYKTQADQEAEAAAAQAAADAAAADTTAAATPVQ